MASKGSGIDLTGSVFGRLTISAEVPNHKNRLRKWACICSCGNRTEVTQSSLVAGRTTSCGCYRNELRTKHNKCYTRIYRIWVGMHVRCYNPKYKRYSDYGGRGIKVVKRWHLFENFYKDMIFTYKDNLTLDRSKVNGNYSKNNCRWATGKEQSRNMRNNRMVSFDGEYRCVSEWAEILGCKKGTITARLNRNWSVKEALYGKK